MDVTVGEKGAIPFSGPAAAKTVSTHPLLRLSPSLDPSFFHPHSFHPGRRAAPSSCLSVRPLHSALPSPTASADRP